MHVAAIAVAVGLIVTLLKREKQLMPIVEINQRPVLIRLFLIVAR